MFKAIAVYPLAESSEGCPKRETKAQHPKLKTNPKFPKSEANRVQINEHRAPYLMKRGRSECKNNNIL